MFHFCIHYVNYRKAPLYKDYQSLAIPCTLGDLYSTQAPPCSIPRAVKLKVVPCCVLKATTLFASGQRKPQDRFVVVDYC